MIKARKNKVVEVVFLFCFFYNFFFIENKTEDMPLDEGLVYKGKMRRDKIDFINNIKYIFLLYNI